MIDVIAITYILLIFFAKWVICFYD